MNSPQDNGNIRKSNSYRVGVASRVDVPERPKAGNVERSGQERRYAENLSTVLSQADQLSGYAEQLQVEITELSTRTGWNGQPMSERVTVVVSEMGRWDHLQETVREKGTT